MDDEAGDNGSDFTRLALGVFALNGALLAAGDALVADLGLTSARWQALGALALRGEPASVAQIARDMGLTRQAVQRIADRLAEEGFLRFRDNPADRRAPVATLTAKGRRAYDEAMRRQGPWAQALTEAVGREEIARAADILARLTQALRAQR